MKKHLLFLSFLLITQICFAQKSNFKIGPSVLINYDAFHEQVRPAYGVEAAYELGLKEKWSWNIAGSFHYGKTENGWETNRTLGNDQEDFITALQTDIRYHFDERYKGFYIGIGADAKYLVARYFFTPTETDPVPTLGDVERNIGVTLGTYIGRINPHLYLGGDPSGVNEYSIHAKAGVSYVF